MIGHHSKNPSCLPLPRAGLRNQPPNHPETLYSGSLDLITRIPSTLKSSSKILSQTNKDLLCVAQGTILKILLITYNGKECKKECTYTHIHTHTHTHTHIYVASQVALAVKNLSVNAGDIRDTSSIPGSGRSPGGGHVIHSSILAWRVPWTEEPDGLQSIGLQRVGYD